MIDGYLAFETLPNYQVQLIQLLINIGVRFVVVGGYAVRCHGHLRQTKDLDLFLGRSSVDCAGLCEALKLLNTENADDILDKACRKIAETNEELRWDNDKVEIFCAMGDLDFSQVYEEKLTVGSSDGLSIPVMSK